MTRSRPLLSLLGLAATFVAIGCTGTGTDAGSADTVNAGNSADARAAAAAIDTADLLRMTQDLAADSMEGRGPGTSGEERTVAYLTRRFQALGLEPGNPDGTYIQSVSLIGYTARPTASFTAGGRTIAMRFPDDYVANSRHNRASTQVQGSDIVFVGYGVVAPEYGWDDYKGVDVRGKTVVMLINDPAVAVAGASGDSAALDSAMFKGRAMTYYGRWTYKYEIASEKGAAAAIIIHETGPAGYPYDVVKGSWGREVFDVKTTGANARVDVESWMTFDKARELFQAAGQDLDALRRAARQRDFRPVALEAKATFNLATTVRETQSRNVIARFPGGARKDEHVIYTAHWDHLGRDTTAQGDQIFNGALDNASGTAAMLEIAEAFTKLPTPPARSVLFLAVTAEEQGLLGAKYYAANPLYPLDQAVANLNLDGVNQWGPTSDVTVVGLGNSTLDDVLAGVLTADGRRVVADPESHKGFYYRSDHFEFAKKGVPALYIGSGIDYIGKPASYSQEKRDEYTAVDYHKVTDEVKATWDLGGAVEDARALFRVGYAVAHTPLFPEWKAGNEFKARRDSMMAKRR